MIVWGERCLNARRPRALLSHRRAPRASPTTTAPACSRFPAGANGRGLREAGVLPDVGPGLRASSATTVPARGRGARRSPAPPRTASSPRCTCSRPTRCATSPTAPLWERALQRAPPGRRARLGAHRGPARARQRDLPRRVARREGGHGRAPRRPPAAAAPRDRPSRASVRAGWSVLAELAKRAGLDTGVLTSPMAFSAAGRRRCRSIAA